MSGTDPTAIDAKTSRRSGAGSESGVVLKEVDERFAWLGFCERVLGDVRLNIELRVDGTATGGGGRNGGSTLREAGCAKEQEQNRKKRFHVLAPKTASNDLEFHAETR